MKQKAGTSSVIYDMKAGGYIGIATALAAWYASFAGVANSTFGRTVMPVRPFNRA